MFFNTSNSSCIIFFNRLGAKVFQVILFSIALIFLFITAVVVAAGWAKTCYSFKSIHVHPQFSQFSCTGNQYKTGQITDGRQIIASAVS